MTESHAGYSVPGPARISRRLSAVLLILAAGCSAMEGVNVGASVPIGGIGSIGANTTVGQGKAPAPTQRPAPKSSEEEPDEEPEAESGDASSVDG